MYYTMVFCLIRWVDTLHKQTWKEIANIIGINVNGWFLFNEINFLILREENIVFLFYIYMKLIQTCNFSWLKVDQSATMHVYTCSRILYLSQGNFDPIISPTWVLNAHRCTCKSSFKQYTLYKLLMLSGNETFSKLLTLMRNIFNTHAI